MLVVLSALASCLHPLFQSTMTPVVKQQSTCALAGLCCHHACRKPEKVFVGLRTRLFLPHKPRSWVRRVAGTVATALSRAGRLLVLLLIFSPLMATAHLALHFNFHRTEWLSWLRCRVRVLELVSAVKCRADDLTEPRTCCAWLERSLSLHRHDVTQRAFRGR